MSSPSPDLRTPLLRRQLLSTRVSAPNEELPSDQYQGRLFPGSLPRGLLHRGFFSPQGALGRLDRRALHIRTVSSNGWGHLLCQLTNVIYHLRQRLDIGASGWWKLLNFFFFQDGLAATWQTEMFSWAVALKVQSPSAEKHEYQPDFLDGETLQVNSTIGSTYSSCLPQVLYQHFFSSPLVFCRLQTLRGWKQAPSFFWFPHGT